MTLARQRTGCDRGITLLGQGEQRGAGGEGMMKWLRMGEDWVRTG